MIRRRSLVAFLVVAGTLSLTLPASAQDDGGAPSTSAPPTSSTAPATTTSAPAATTSTAPTTTTAPGSVTTAPAVDGDGTTTSTSTSSAVPGSTVPPTREVAEYPPAPPGFAQRIADLYRTMSGVVSAAEAAGAPPAAILSPDQFEDRMASAPADQLAQLHHATRSLDLEAIERSYGEIAATAAEASAVVAARGGGSSPDAGTTANPSAADEPTSVPTTSSADKGRAGDEGGTASATMGPVLSALVHGAAEPALKETSLSVAAATGIEPPPDPYIAVPPVGPTETLECPELPPGGFVGNYAINAAKIAQTALKTAAAAIQDELEFTVPLPLFDLVIEIPNPFKATVQLAAQVAEVAALSLTFLRDRYWDCGGVDSFRQAYNLDNVTQHLYALLGQADGTSINVVNGLLTVSDQIDGLQSTAVQAIDLRINEALTRSLEDAPSIALMLPASEGGYLDAVPVGVQGLVTRALNAAQTAGLPVNSAAPLYLRMADQALDEGQYARAFVLYQKTYQHLGR